MAVSDREHLSKLPVTFTHRQSCLACKCHSSSKACGEKKNTVGAASIQSRPALIKYSDSQTLKRAHTHTHTHTRTHTHAHTHTHTHTYKYAHISTRTHIQKRARTRTHEHTCTHARTSACTHMCTHTHTHIQTHHLQGTTHTHCRPPHAAALHESQAVGCRQCTADVDGHAGVQGNE